MRQLSRTGTAWACVAAIALAAAAIASAVRGVREDMATPNRARIDSNLAESPIATGVDARDGERLGLYGQFAGSWDIDVMFPAIDGPAGHRTGEWIFGRVLEGAAIQDVWRLHANGNLTGRSGTTLRFPLADGTWRIVWVSPATGAVDVMTAWRVGGEIVQSGRDAEGSEFRWVFYDISENAFRWRAETRAADGRWTLDQRMTAVRLR